ncbi:RagB/SusD family nutrient uptake outer membrane protein [Chitinophaga lutea]
MQPTYRNICMAAGFTLAFSACNLVNVTDVDPVNKLFEENAITSVQKAQSVLYGCYGQLKTTEYLTYFGCDAALLGLTMKPGPSAGAENTYYANDVTSNDYHVDALYTTSYRILNNAAHIIDKTSKLESTDPRKEEIVSEARFIRALSHFYLLRRYGQFFKQDSKYGIALRDLPLKEVKAEPRADVKTTYEHILADLTYAAEKGPQMPDTSSTASVIAKRSAFYATRQAALALKAKVLLYMRNYPEAAAAAEAVIKSGKYRLENEYSDIFSKKIVGTLEVIFQLPYDEKQDRNNKAFMLRSYYVPSDYYVNLMKPDKRYAAAIATLANGTIRNNKYNGTVFNGQTLTADTEYFLRLDEMYLILAEAKARLGQTDDALKALNAIRKRAHMPDITTTAKAALLEAIRMEKILELGAESGEEWYDLIRYATEGDLKVSTYKPTVTTENQYILPLPFETVQLSNNVTEQNPGY